MRLTKKRIDDLLCEGTKPEYIWDSAVSGFGVKTLPSGRKTFVIKYRIDGGGRGAKQRWFTIGRYGNITLDQARRTAQQALAAVARGEDPQGQRQTSREAPKLRDVWEKFVQEEFSQKKPNTVSDYQSMWTNTIEPKLGNQKVLSVSRSDVQALHISLKSTPYRGNRVLSLISKLMSQAEAWEWREQGTNPCRYVKRFEEKSRERYIRPEEISRLAESMRELVLQRSVGQDIVNAITLLLLTGARKSEIITAKWGWVDAERRCLDLPDSKTGKKSVYLSDAALQILEIQKGNMRQPGSEFIFPGNVAGKHLINIAKPWRKIRDKAGLTDVRLHDLRHTAASIAVGQGIGLPIVGRILGHSQTQTTQRYAHVDADPALSAVNIIGDIVSNAMK